MTTTTAHRRMVAEMERRLASARQLIERMVERYEEDRAKYAAQREADYRSWSAATGEAHADGVLGGLQMALDHLHAAFDDRERDWMYQR